MKVIASIALLVMAVFAINGVTAIVDNHRGQDWMPAVCIVAYAAAFIIILDYIWPKKRHKFDQSTLNAIRDHE